jgi:acetylornithine deacetylase
MYENLKETFEKNKEKYIKYLADLVAIDTHDIGHGIEGGMENKGQKYLAELLKKMGADSVVCDPMREEVICDSIHKYHEGNPGHNYDNRFNVYAEFHGKGDKSIMFNGHMDTMPAGDESKWNIPPHMPSIHDSNMYGLGVCDMKGGLMAAVMAVQLLQDAGVELPGTVKIVSVVDEEGGGNGSIAAAMNGQKADGVVVCEPTSCELVIAHMGFIFFQVDVEGVPVHSGSKWLGVSAIEKATKLMAAIDELEHKWLLIYKHPLLPPPTSNVGVIEGGTAGSTVAAHCCFKSCVHYQPGSMSHEQVVKEYTDAIYRCCEGDEWLRNHKPRISIYQSGGPFEMNADHPFVTTFQNAIQHIIGEEQTAKGTTSGCDSRIWKNIAKCPTIQYGPGNMAQCHTINEYMPLDQYKKAILSYAALILEWCGR